jgi:hypothetical protein
MGIALPTDTVWLQERRTRWLRSALSETSMPRLARELYGTSEADGKALGRHIIRQILSGRRKPGANLVWRIGEYLPRCGVTAWNGPTALYAVGYSATVVAFLAQLAEGGRLEQSVALDLFCALPLAVEVELDSLVSGSCLAWEIEGFKVANNCDLPVLACREFIATSIARLRPELSKKAWDAAVGADPMKGVRSEIARHAFETFGLSIPHVRARDFAWQLLEDWALEFADPWDTDERAKWRHWYSEWQRLTTTSMDDERERLRESARYTRLTPTDRASRERFCARVEADESRVEVADALVRTKRKTEN